MPLTYIGRHRKPRRRRYRSSASAAALVTIGCLAAGAPSATATPAPTSKAARAWPVLRLGSTGAHVVAIQRIVGVTADGVFGPKTTAAVRRYQGRHHLTPDGVVGARTAAAMRRGPATPKPATHKAAPAKAAPTKAASTKAAHSVVAIAAAYTGIPYRRGGTGPGGFDCSGYTSFVYRKAGRSIPRTAAAQQAAARRVSTPRPGDLVFFGSPAYHVGIYAGGGYMFDAGKPGLVTQRRKVFAGVSGYGRF
jgi:cell wall-associated NlpC family hydrolase